MAFLIRRWVSQGKKRYQKDGYDLDLSYITSRIIGMGFPARGGEGLYRNPMSQVAKMLQRYHKGHFKVYNLCSERQYPAEQMQGPVANYPSDDHQPPPVALIWSFCRDAAEWLLEDPTNVVAVHCKAGKGRTGVMICCLLLYLHHNHPDIFTLDGMELDAQTSEDAERDTAGAVRAVLRLYAEQRTHDMNGVTIASQVRFVHFFYRELTGKVDPGPSRQILLKEIRINAPSTMLRGCVVSVVPRCTDPVTGMPLCPHSRSPSPNPSSSVGPAAEAAPSSAQPGRQMPQMPQPLCITIPSAPSVLGIQCITGDSKAAMPDDNDTPVVSCHRSQSVITFAPPPAPAGAASACAQTRPAPASSPRARALFSGDVKVQLYRGSTALCHLWLNTQHMQPDGCFTLLAEHLDKVHSSLPCDISVEIEYELLEGGRQLAAGDSAAAAQPAAQEAAKQARSHSAPVPSAFQSSAAGSMLADALAGRVEKKQQRSRLSGRPWSSSSGELLKALPPVLPPSSQQWLSVTSNMKPVAYAAPVGCKRVNAVPAAHPQRRRWAPPAATSSADVASPRGIIITGSPATSSSSSDSSDSSDSAMTSTSAASTADSSASFLFSPPTLPQAHTTPAEVRVHADSTSSRPSTPAALRSAAATLTAALAAATPKQHKHKASPSRSSRFYSTPGCYLPTCGTFDDSDSSISDSGHALLLEPAASIASSINEHYFSPTGSPPRKPIVLPAPALPGLRPCMSEGQLLAASSAAMGNASGQPSPITNCISLPNTPHAAVDAISLRWWGMKPVASGSSVVSTSTTASAGASISGSGATTPTSPTSTPPPSWRSGSATSSPGSPGRILAALSRSSSSGAAAIATASSTAARAAKVLATPKPPAAPAIVPVAGSPNNTSAIAAGTVANVVAQFSFKADRTTSPTPSSPPKPRLSPRSTPTKAPLARSNSFSGSSSPVAGLTTGSTRASRAGRTTIRERMMQRSRSYSRVSLESLPLISEAPASDSPEPPQLPAVRDDAWAEDGAVEVTASLPVLAEVSEPVLREPASCLPVNSPEWRSIRSSWERIWGPMSDSPERRERKAASASPARAATAPVPVPAPRRSSSTNSRGPVTVGSPEWSNLRTSWERIWGSDFDD